MKPRVLILLCATLVLAGCGGTTLLVGSPTRVATITAEAPASASPVPAGFVGLSIELYSLERFTGADPAAINPVFVALVRRLVPGQRPVLRLGGDSADKSWIPTAGSREPPWVAFTFTPNWLAVAGALAAELRARLIVGINLEAGSTRLAGDEARALLAGLPRGSVQALELGNEPELYSGFNWYRTASGVAVKGRSPSWNPTAYAAQVHAISRALSGVPLAGPAVGSRRWERALGTILAADRNLSPVTLHAYPLKRCSARAHVTAAQLLAPAASGGLAASLAPEVALARRAGHPLRLAETGSVSCGGEPGVSNSFASALWSLDTLLALARQGVAGVNFHTTPKLTNRLFAFARTGGRWTGIVEPVYYGALLFAQAAPPGSRLLSVRGASAASRPVWALRTSTGELHVVLIDKQASGTERLALRLPGAHGPGRLERLTAPSLTATGGITLGGQSFGAQTTTGRLTGAPETQSVRPSGGVYRITVPAHSAALLEVR